MLLLNYVIAAIIAVALLMLAIGHLINNVRGAANNGLPAYPVVVTHLVPLLATISVGAVLSTKLQLEYRVDLYLTLTLSTLTYTVTYGVVKGLNWFLNEAAS